MADWVWVSADKAAQILGEREFVTVKTLDDSGNPGLQEMLWEHSCWNDEVNGFWASIPECIEVVEFAVVRERVDDL
jgi:hypothetical protein